MEAAMGRAGQANCTLPTAGRFLTGGDGGGAQGNWAVCALLYTLLGSSGVGVQVDPVHLAELGPEECWWVACLEILTHPPQGRMPHSLLTHPGRFCHVLLWPWFLGVLGWAFHPKGALPWRLTDRRHLVQL